MPIGKYCAQNMKVTASNYVVMKAKRLHFKIPYNQSEGEILLLVVECAKGYCTAYSMSSFEDGIWRVSIDAPQSETIRYFYAIIDKENDNDKEVKIDSDSSKKDISSLFKKRELGALHIHKIENSRGDVQILDYWRDKSKYLPLYSSATTEALLKREEYNEQTTLPAIQSSLIYFEISAPALKPSEKVIITGSGDQLGNWDPDSCIELSCDFFPLWYISMPKSIFTSNTEFKFAIKGDDGTLTYETGDNRVLQIDIDLRDNIYLYGGEPDFGTRDLKFAGCAIPLFSLRSSGNYGIGDIASLKLLIQWCASNSLNVIQLLPINDTTLTHTWRDSYPYNAISIYAIHPLYMDLKSLGEISNYAIRKRLNGEASMLNSLSEIDYERVDKLKWSYMRVYFAEHGETIIKDQDFINWFKDNMWWVEPYAYFSALREYFDTPDSAQWGEYKRFNLSKLRRKSREDAKFNTESTLHIFIQYYLHKQLSEARAEAREAGVVLKGDIPIGINRKGVDSWTTPELFNMGEQTGAPPDDFSDDGQNWGFPTYNWQQMEKDGYKWWKNRFRMMSKYFDAYRIDHLLGFFRIWSIPTSAKSALLGYFSPATPLTADEIEEYGFEFTKERCSTPYIDEHLLKELFNTSYAKVIERYFNYDEEYDSFTFKSEYDTQSKIAESDCSILYRDRLLQLHNNTLFVVQDGVPDLYHPAINGAKTYSYKILSEEQKRAYDTLHHNYFWVRHNDFWRDNALKLLPEIIDATPMLCCVEDLGMIPPSVPEVINELQLISLEVERMPKEVNREFGDSSRYPYYSVATTSSHDTSTLRMWWEEEHEAAKRYYRDILGATDEAPKELTPQIAEKIIANMLNSPSILVILPLQDWFAIDESSRRRIYDKERINTPSNIDNYWRYRIHISLERLLTLTKFNEKVKELTAIRG